MESGGEVSTYSPNADIIRQQNEIDHMTDSLQVDFDRVKAEIFRLAELKYDCCTYNGNPQKTAKIKALIENHEQLNTLDIGLFKACVSRIWISNFCTIEVELINGVQIKNITEKDNLKAKPSNASCRLLPSIHRVRGTAEQLSGADCVLHGFNQSKKGMDACRNIRRRGNQRNTGEEKTVFSQNY